MKANSRIKWDWLIGALVVCKAQADGYSLVEAGHLQRQKSSTCFSRPLVSSLRMTYWQGVPIIFPITNHKAS